LTESWLIPGCLTAVDRESDGHDCFPLIAVTPTTPAACRWSAWRYRVQGEVVP
jgi:hypothetical protein